ncbi:fibrillin-2-like, partial [Xenia sp. Carnegie-2017]|uniref:fibrillin-2-like n=1 Tax=Xenia sp. Carnegie-2017 TaxID=2897299 RepID=UPI001F034DF1
NNAILRIILRKRRKHYFIGLYRNKSDNQFYTVQNGKPNFTSWRWGQPSHERFGIEDCVIIFFRTWLDVGCGRHFNFICQRERRNLNYIGECQSSPCGKYHKCINIPGSYECLCAAGYKLDKSKKKCIVRCPSDWWHIESSCYFLSAKETTWNKARKLCQEMGGDLAVPKNEFENFAILRTIWRKRSKHYFIGLYRNKSDNQFYTVQNGKPSFTLWHRGKPSHKRFGIEDCVIINYIRWSDAGCGRHFNFICQRERRNLNYIGECQSSPCGKDHSCINIPGSYECLCSTGYKLDKSKKKCIDIGECQSSPCGKDHSCINIPGSYECLCSTGYKLDKSKKKCIDIGECQSSPCGKDHSCINIPGSYECLCSTGYKLDKSKKKCIDIGECQSSPCGKDHSCINIPGSYECLCSTGYKLDKSKKKCIDIGECQSSPCGKDHSCINIPGSYECLCSTGYKLDKSKKKCIASCPSDWLHIESSCYFFSAKAATWNKARKLCQQKGGDLAVPKNNAETNAILRISLRKRRKHYFIGLYRNKSDNQFYTVQNGKPNFTSWRWGQPSHERFGIEDCVIIFFRTWLDVGCGRHFNFICQRERRNLNYIGECQSSPCGKDHSCINIPGSYECLCTTGYKLDKSKKKCIDIGECQSSPCGKDHSCINIPGSYECLCSTGYKLDKSKKKCIDTDECQSSPCSKEHSCVNIPGSYESLCSNGHIFFKSKKKCFGKLVFLDLILYVASLPGYIKIL